jgi:hypothetical protein
VYLLNFATLRKKLTAAWTCLFRDSSKNHKGVGNKITPH